MLQFKFHLSKFEKSLMDNTSELKYKEMEKKIETSVTLFAIFVFCIVYIYDFLIILLSSGVVLLLPNNSVKHQHHSIKRRRKN